MPAARGQTFGAVVGDYFYVFGGSTNYSGSTASNSVYRYSRKTNLWDSPTTMPYAARELVAALLPNGFIYVAGGRDGNTSFKNFSYWYDPYNNTWTAKNNLPVSWMDGTVGTLADGRILICGGSINNNGARTTTSYIYDSDSDTYTVAPSLPFAVADQVAATMADGRIIVAAGNNEPINIIKTQIFDPATMTWALGADQPFEHGQYPGIVATPCGPVYLWGGGGLGEPGTKAVSAYDPSTDTWTVLEDLPFFAGWGAYGRFYDGQYIWASGHDNTAMTAKTYLSTDPVGD
jgi:N-acetylneuraminic acid mutarotase